MAKKKKYTPEDYGDMEYKTSAEPRAMIGDVPVFCSYDELVDIGAMVPHPRNPNTHPDSQIYLLAQIIRAQGWRAPITVSKRSGFIIRGHGRLAAAITLCLDKVPVDYQDYASEAEEYADLIADNRLSELSEINKKDLADMIQDMDTGELPIELTGYSQEDIIELLEELGEASDAASKAKETLKERFIIPPFSILDSRSGDWQARKKAWKAYGIKSEIGRGNDEDNRKGGLTFGAGCFPASVIAKKEKYEKKIGRKVTWDEYIDEFPDETQLSGTSIFDPVLCELFYRWYCPAGGAIIDPFAGGSVRGIVAAMTGRKYTGVDLSERQITANRENWNQVDHEIIIAEADRVGSPAPDPTWICADSRTIDTVVSGEYDLLFTCPPYADLEVYSNDPRDISNMKYGDFLTAYRDIIRKATAKLKNNTFAVCVIGEVRDKRGVYYSFVPDTIKAFQDAGMDYYNEFILINSYASASMRVTAQFNASRKTGKVHQNVLMFTKGDAAEAIKQMLPVLEENMETGRCTSQHQNVLVFSKGSPQAATSGMMPIENETDILLQIEEGGAFDDGEED